MVTFEMDLVLRFKEGHRLLDYKNSVDYGNYLISIKNKMKETGNHINKKYHILKGIVIIKPFYCKGFIEFQPLKQSQHNYILECIQLQSIYE